MDRLLGGASVLNALDSLGSLRSVQSRDVSVLTEKLLDHLVFGAKMAHQRQLGLAHDAALRTLPGPILTRHSFLAGQPKGEQRIFLLKYLVFTYNCTWSLIDAMTIDNPFIMFQCCVLNST